LLERNNAENARLTKMGDIYSQCRPRTYTTIVSRADYSSFHFGTPTQIKFQDSPSISISNSINYILITYIREWCKINMRRWDSYSFLSSLMYHDKIDKNNIDLPIFGCCSFLHIRASRSSFWKSVMKECLFKYV